MTTERKIEKDLITALNYIVSSYRRLAIDDIDGSIYSNSKLQISAISLVFSSSPLLVHVEKAQKDLAQIWARFPVFGGLSAPLASINGQGGN